MCLRTRTRIVNQTLGPAVPFMGDFSGTTRSVQSLHNEDGNTRNRKVVRLKQLLRCSDFVALQETFSTRGFEQGFSPPQGCKMWWSHDSSRDEPLHANTPLVKRKGGIALAVKDSFLKLFETSNWAVATKGRAAVLQLRGDLGGGGGTRRVVYLLARQRS